MIHIDGKNDYSVCITKPLEGSGLLYAPEGWAYAYILTVAHLIPTVDGEEIQVCFWDKKRIGGIREVTYHLAEKAEKTSGTDRNCRCKILKGYDREVGNSPHDGAVIEIPYEDWMGRTAYILGDDELEDSLDGQRLVGIGFPLATKNAGLQLPNRDCFRCQIQRVAKAPDDEIASGEDLDYVISYDPDQYRTSQDAGNEGLDGFSGTGMFLEVEEDGKPEKCIGFLSRDAAGSPREYLTNAYRLWLLIDEMQTDHPAGRNYQTLKIKGRYVEYEEILADHTGEGKTSDLESILNAVLDNPDDYFRCICGFTGIGKSSVVNQEVERRRKEKGTVVMHGWHRLIDFLKAWDKEAFSGSIFILDPLEQYIEGKERALLFNKKTVKKEEASMQMLAVDEKIKLIKEIYDKEADLQQCNIHILFVCHNFFMKDAEKKMEQSTDPNDRLMAAWLEKHYIYCDGFSKEQIREIFDKEGEGGIPEYFFEIPILRHPLWVKHILDIEGMQPRGEEGQYSYEFRLYYDTFGWFQQIGDAEGKRRAIAAKESGLIKNSVEQYIKFILENRNRDRLQWDGILSYVLWCYPFRETKDGFQMDDEILQSYLIARTIYDKLRDKKEQEVLAGLRAVLDIGKTDRPIQEIWGRVSYFLHALIAKDDPSGEREVYLEGLVQRHSEVREWLYEGNVLLHMEGRGRSAVSVYYNIKTKSYLSVQKENEMANTKMPAENSYIDQMQWDTVRKR